MSPSSAHDPLDDGNAPWQETPPTTSVVGTQQDTRPLPRPDTPQNGLGDIAAMPSVPPDDAAPATSGHEVHPTGRTGVASGRLHRRDSGAGPADPVGDDHLTRPGERISASAAWDTMRPAVRPDAGSAVAGARPSPERLRARQKGRFGGMQFVPGFMGLLTAVSLGALLLAAAALLGPQFGIDTASGAGDTLARAWNGAGSTQLWGGVAVLGATEFLSLLAGGYVAGRMARFSGVVQGVGVWLWSLVARAAVSGAVLLWGDAVGADGGRWQVQQVIGSHPGVGLVALAGVLALGLAGAVLGGAWGMRYHRTVDAWTISHAWE